MLRSLLQVTALSLSAMLCSAQAGKVDHSPQSYAERIPKPFSGTVLSVAGDTVTLADKDGTSFVVLMTPGWTVSVNRTADASVIKPGDFIATTNVPIDASTGRATEVRVLEPGYRPEMGTHPVSPTDPKMMTHAKVSSVSTTATGMELVVTSPEGSRHIVVPSGVRVTVSDPLPRTTLKPGTPVSGVTRTDANGVARSSRLQPMPESHGSSF